MPEDNAEMILNRPFVYGIIAPRGTLLFIGVCGNPSRK
jgi:serpin B